jgi:hypothetical protein
VVAAQVPDGGGGTRTVYILGRADGTIQFDSFAASLVGEAEGLGSLPFNAFDDRAPADFTRIDIEIVTTEVAETELIIGRIDASVTNILQGPAGAPELAADVAAIAATQARIGNIATTALGSVNTGEIALIGAGLELTDMLDDAVGGAGRAVQRRVNATIAQVGGDVAAPVIVLNAALNEGAVDGAVLNIISGLDAEIGRSGFTFAPERAIDGASLAGVEAEAIAALAGGIGTTALGAVNTGEIVSGVASQIDGTVAGIVGGIVRSP